jgi:hypothetical protein
MEKQAFITTHSGYTLHWSKFSQEAMYAFQLEGIPNRERNEEHIQELKDKANGPAHCVPYVAIPWENAEDCARYLKNKGQILEFTPPICCVARLTSSCIVDDPDNCYSYATLIWFQDEFGIPTDEKVLEKIRAVDWENVAEDWFW